MVVKKQAILAHGLHFGKLIAADIAQDWSHICLAFRRFNVMYRIGNQGVKSKATNVDAVALNID